MYIMGKIQVCVRNERRLNYEVALFDANDALCFPFTQGQRVSDSTLELCEHVIELPFTASGFTYRAGVFSLLTHQFCGFESI